MNKGVEILLQRMDSNPDEFIPDPPYSTFPSKWGDIVRAIVSRKQNLEPRAPYFDLAYLTDEEVTLLYDKILKIQGDNFTKHIMAKLLGDDSSEEEYEQKLVARVTKSELAKIKAQRDEMQQRMQIELLSSKILEAEKEDLLSFASSLTLLAQSKNADNNS